MKIFLFVVATLLFSVTLLGCGGKPGSKTTKEGKLQQNNRGGTVDAPLQYPELYTNEQLPQYNKAQLMSTGRQTASLKDGIRIELHSSQSVQTIAKFYETELKQLGWNVPEPKVRNETMYMAHCTKGELKYSLIITGGIDGKPTNIKISLISK